MGQKIEIDDKQYDVDDLSENAKAALAYFQFTNSQIRELKNMEALLGAAKNRYMENLQKEMISHKAGLILEDD